MGSLSRLATIGANRGSDSRRRGATMLRETRLVSMISIWRTSRGFSLGLAGQWYRLKPRSA
jgi:hypothetical protein